MKAIKTISPNWRIVPTAQASDESRIDLIVGPGAGWGDGAHETTKLCLQALTLMAPVKRKVWRLLDFGSGSGILSIGAAKLGATVIGVEIDPEAIANSEENARLNGVEDRACFSSTLEHATGRFELIIANILRPVLMEFASSLVERLEEKGILILSGLVGTDVPEVSVRYASFLSGRQPEVYSRGDWRALIWRPGAAGIGPAP